MDISISVLEFNFPIIAVFPVLLQFPVICLPGEVWVGDLCVSAAPLSETSKKVGRVFQNPKSQFFNVDSTGELVFGCENQGMAREEIRRRLDRTVDDACKNRNNRSIHCSLSDVIRLCWHFSRQSGDFRRKRSGECLIT